MIQIAVYLASYNGLKWIFENIDRAVYIGGGTGIADGLIINGQVVNFNLDSYLKKSWELILPSGKTVESALSPKFLIENYNMINPKNSVNTLNEIILEADNNNPYAIEIVEHAVIALHFLIENRLKYINEKTGKNCQKIIVGQRLGIALSLKNGRNSFMKNILSKIDVPFQYLMKENCCSWSRLEIIVLLRGKIPSSEPIINIGLVLPDDQIKEIKISCPNQSAFDLFINDSANESKKVN